VIVINLIYLLFWYCN